MKRRLRRVVAVALAIAACAGCVTQRNAARPPRDADERLADTIMDRIEVSDMRPVVADFVPERKSVLLDPARVKSMHEFIAAAGPFMGARAFHVEHTIDARTVYLTAYFAYGEQALTMFFNDKGKIIHYRLGAG